MAFRQPGMRLHALRPGLIKVQPDLVEPGFAAWPVNEWYN